MSEKEIELLNYITDYYNQNKIMPTRRYLQNIMNYKSVNSITQYLCKLENKKYLIRNNDNKLVLNDYTFRYKDEVKNINVINMNNQYIPMVLNKKKNYYCYKIKHSYFSYLGIFKNDLLIIEENKKLKTNNLGLFIIDGKYRIMKYNYKNGFYILNDYEELILSKVKIIGKVIIVEKKL